MLTGWWKKIVTAITAAVDGEGLGGQTCNIDSHIAADRYKTGWLGIFPLSIVWPSGWTWGHGHSHYLMMIVGVYATLGVFLLLASRDPQAHSSIIWFTVWSSVVHGAIMAVQSFTDPMETGHLIADVPALFIVAIVLGVLMLRAEKT